ncbi:MAG: DUF4198 domain-containing protein [Hydrogenophaga sp.]|uniref:DUF4198 domain-containing protein n=1 Tax=Hydrogenophaga sp. TaxID=1904254 RepID=UPI002ABA068D|nr:DUF4198 domain-containing protein [Hydrogenophaga sp.]MDZ4282689.1 DUF4198 domain-containing protein [Hydrogenophaga sp.]
MNKWIFSSLLGLASAAQAHEFWIAPDRFSPPTDAPVTLSLRVGEGFLGEPVGFGQPMAVSLRWHNLRGNTDLTPQLPATEQASVQLSFDQPGTQLIALDTQPISTELAADEFTAYLREDGLERVIAQRQVSGQSALPGRERYRRHIKTMLHVGGKSDSMVGVRTGQTLEIVPLMNPQRLQPGDALPVEVLFEGAPLPRALVKFWSRRGQQFDMVTTRTDAAGKSTTALPWHGAWMVSVVHMVPNVDGKGHDWDSHWANLTFELPAASSAERKSQ